MTHARLSLALSLVLLLAGCPAPPSPPKSSPAPVKPNSTSQTAARAAVEGRAVAPAGMVAAGAGNIMSHNGGQMVAAGAGNYRRLMALSESPLAGAEVFLADAAGNPVPGVKPVTTGPDGRYKLDGVPANTTYTVNVRVKTKGKDATLRTIARAGEPGADVSAATTCVLVSILGDKKQLGSFNAGLFKTAVEAVSRELTLETLPDFADPKAVADFMKSLLGRVAALEQAVSLLSADLGRVEVKLDEVNAKLDDVLGKLGSGGLHVPPTATPTPEPEAEDEPDAPTPAPTAAPSAKAVPVGPFVLTVGSGMTLTPGTAEIVKDLEYRGTLKFEGRPETKGRPAVMRVIADPRSGDSKRNAADVTLVAIIGDMVTVRFPEVELPARYRIHADMGDDPAAIDMAKDSADQVGYFKISRQADGTIEVDFDWEPDKDDGRTQGLLFSDVK